MAQNVFVPVTTLGAAKGHNKPKKNIKGEVYLDGGGELTVQGYKDYVEGSVALHGGGSLTVVGQKDTLPAVYGVGAATMSSPWARARGLVGTEEPAVFEPGGTWRTVYPSIRGRGRAVVLPPVAAARGAIGVSGAGIGAIPPLYAAGFGLYSPIVLGKGHGAALPAGALVCGAHGNLGDGVAVGIFGIEAKGKGAYELFSDKQLEEIIALLSVA